MSRTVARILMEANIGHLPTKFGYNQMQGWKVINRYRILEVNFHIWPLTYLWPLTPEYHGGQYAFKAQTSLAPLSWFPGSNIPTAHVHQCCRFQSYANSHAIAYEIYKRNLQSVNHIPGIHDNRRPVTFDFNSVYRASTNQVWLQTDAGLESYQPF